jgi:hypothetical protein
MRSSLSYPDSVREEFRTVDILLASQTLTGRTDAFIVAWTKSEKQVRRIFTYLIYQYPAFSKAQVKRIFQLIASKRYLYFDSFIQGFDGLYPLTFETVVGNRYQSLRKRLLQTRQYRNKILHGQPTGQSLTAKQLRDEVDLIREWCDFVARGMSAEIEYDGFARNSFRKSRMSGFSDRYRVQITSIDELDKFIETKMR